MGKAWHAVAVWFGFREPDREPAEIRFVAPALTVKAAGCAVLAVTSAVLAIAVFGKVTPGLVAIAAGVVVFGAITYLSEVQGQMPAAPLLRLPGDARIVAPGDERRGLVKRLPTVLPLLALAIWMGDTLFGEGLWVFLTGQFAGMALAYLVGAARVARWQRVHGGRLAARTAGGRVTALYDVRTVSAPDGASRPAIGSASGSSGLS